MAVLNRQIYKRIEYYLYNYFALKRELQQKREEILHSQGNSKDVLKLEGILSSQIDIDTTAAKATRLYELQEKEKWLKVIEAVLKRYKNTEKGRLIEKKYFEELGEVHICRELHIERRTYYMWRNEIVLFAAIIAAQEGLLKVV